jgi:hypothetical protein
MVVPRGEKHTLFKFAWKLGCAGDFPRVAAAAKMLHFVQRGKRAASLVSTVGLDDSVWVAGEAGIVYFYRLTYWS